VATSLKDSVAIVGVGVTYYEPGAPDALGPADAAIMAAQAALADAGLDRSDLEGFAWASGANDPGGMAAQMGVPEVSFSANLTSGAGGGAGALGLAASAILGGFARACLTLVTVQGAPRRPGTSSSGRRPKFVAGAGAYGGPVNAEPEDSFTVPAGIESQAEQLSMVLNRYGHQFSMTREQLGEVCITQRANAGETLSLDEYLGSPMIVEPLSQLDCTPELEGTFAAAVITTTLERAHDLRQPPVVLVASATGGDPAAALFQGAEDSFASSGHRAVAAALYEMAGLSATDIDVALLYDDFSPMVLLQLEDYGFCGVGEGGAFVADGHIRGGGSIPVNTHGGNLSQAYLRGATHVVEAVHQLRGTAANQVSGAELALVTGSPSSIPLSAAILRKA
jgi:acetyl-CoA acetyltransferase